MSAIAKADFAGLTDAQTSLSGAKGWFSPAGRPALALPNQRRGTHMPRARKRSSGGRRNAPPAGNGPSFGLPEPSRLLSGPVFSQPQPTPDPTIFKVRHPSDGPAYKEIDA